MNRRLQATLLLCVVALSASGCGEADNAARVQTPVATSGPSAARGAAKGWDCAALLTTQDVERIVGRGGARIVSSVRGDANQEAPGHTECGYELPPAGGLHFFVNTGPALASGSDLRGSAQRNKAEKLSGIGDEAWTWDLKGKSFSAVAVVKGAEVFVGVGNEGGQGKAIAQHVLQTVVSRL